MNKTRFSIKCNIILLIAVPVVAVCLFYASLPLPSDSAHKVAHFSFDDVYEVLLDITEHEPVYASAFDNPFLGSLKRLHELYEAKFVLYVYDTYPEVAFDIADVSVKYQSEFMANSGWLKFGYHTIEPTTSFDKETSLAAFKTSFSKVKDAIGRFAGEASFSNVLRLNYFRGDDDKVAFLASQGITALLCADDDRASYNLPETQNLLLQKNDYIVYQDMKYLKRIFASTGSGSSHMNCCSSGIRKRS